MKKSFILLVLLLTGSMVYAQLKQGAFKVGAGITYSLAKTNTTNALNSTFSFGPEVGYLVKDKWEVTAFLKKSMSTDNISGMERQTNFTDVGFGVKRYFPIHEKLAPFAMVSTSYGYGEVKSEKAIRSDFNFLNTTISTGVSYFVTKHIGITAQVSLVKLDFLNERGLVAGANTQKLTNLDFDMTNSIGIGLAYYFY